VFAVDHGYLLRFARDLAYAMPTIINWPNTDALHHSEEEAHVGWDPDHRDLMPTDDYLTFYAECERSLPPTMFTEVHNLYVDSLNRTLQWIETIGANDFNIDDVKRAMAVLTGEQTNISEALVALRGAQAAFHRNGWLLKYEDSVILYGVLRFPPSAPTLSQWRALRAYRNPHPAASIALYLCGMTVSEINQITVSDLAAWHATGEPIGTTDINPEAEPYLRAHLYNLLGSNPDPNRLALGAIKANGQTSTKVRAAIREAATKLGTSIGDAVTLTDVSRDNRHIGNKTFELERLG
jgi:integrase